MMALINNKKDILKESFKSTFARTFWGGVGIASLFSLVGPVNLLWRISDKLGFEIALYVGLGCLVLIALRFLWFVAKYTFIYLHDMYQETQWGNNMILLKEIQTRLSVLRERPYDEAEIKKEIVGILDVIRASLNRITASECGYSIKVPRKYNKDLANWELRNIFRDSTNISRDTSKYSEIHHTVIHNTPFSRVIAHVTDPSGNSFSYVNENIPETNNYENTSKAAYDGGLLPYQSEVVSPIMIYSKSYSNRCTGFLCLDCRDSECFGRNSEYIVALNETLAEYLYPVMELILNRQNEQS